MIANTRRAAQQDYFFLHFSLFTGLSTPKTLATFLSTQNTGPPVVKRFFNALSDRTSRDLDRINGKGLTRLQQAADDNDTDRIHLLIRRKADVNETGLCGESALHRAVRQKHYNSARLLVELGADVNLPDASGKTALHHAVASGHLSTINRLLEAGADVSVADHEGRTPLHLIPAGHEEFVLLLRARGADVNAPDKKGYAPLNYNLHNPRIVHALLACGANPNYSNPQPSPLVTALSLGLHATHTQVVQHLIDHGGDINARSATTQEPLIHLAARSGQKGLLLDALLRKADVYALDPHGMSIVHAMTQLPQPDLLRMVLLRAPDLASLRARAGATPLHIVLDHLARAPSRGTETHVATLIQLTRLLVTSGADPNITMADGTTLLHEAAARNLPELIDFLVGHKANLNARDAQGNAPLHVAIDARNLEMLDRLLDHGADPDLVDARGWTLLDRLAERKDRDSPVVQRLIVAGGQYNKQLPLYPDMIRPRKDAPRLPAGDTPDRPTHRLPPADDNSAPAPVKKIIKRLPPP